MKILLTGARGFSGSMLAEKLPARGHDITAIVRSRDSCPAETERLKLVVQDISEPISVAETPDAIVHAAALSPAPGVAIEHIARANVIGTRRLVDFARARAVRKFIFLSSLSVYGRIGTDVVDETTPVIDPDAYGLTKLEGEKMLAAQAEFCWIAIRLPGVIGRNSVRNWLTTVMVNARNGSEITIFNPEAPFNNAIHVEDLAEFIADLIEQDWQGGDAVTIGAAGSTTIGAATQTIVESFGGRSHVRVSKEARHSFTISSKRASEKYGYKPRDIHEILLRFCRDNGGA